ncbi:MAG TPA: Uma2 family endonuclease [Humisphaera sp.]|jgi:Uma2 family endonuclease|nr:Uma2 family endonuclease [Humisphaera sp.]
MSVVQTKPFEPGTTGWSASDLDDPRVEAKWERGSYEIINGVLTQMPAAYFLGGEACFNLMAELRQQLKQKRIPGGFSFEVDLIIDEQRVVRGDSCFMTPADKKKQATEARKRGKPDPTRARIYVPPTIVIESISPGHQAHDRVTKFAWYAEFGVKHFWIIDAYERTLDTFQLERGKFKAVDELSGDTKFEPIAFPSIRVDLKEVWPDLG